MISSLPAKLVLLFHSLHATRGAGAAATNNNATSNDNGGSVQLKNPFQRGCLHAKNLAKRIRVCSSEDPPSAISEGICREAPFDYAEVRIQPGDWDSTFFGTWILQVLLSEVLQVPVSIEMGDPQSSVSLYHPDNPLQYHSNYGDYLLSYENANKYKGDCSKANEDEEEYQPCAHFTPEDWTAKSLDVEELVFRDVLEPPKSLNMLASQGWFIPKFTAQRDPTLLSYLGMQGEANRQKLAEAFKRPQSWQYYCNHVSTNNCSTPDEVAERPPNSTNGEPDQFYVEGVYNGYFLATDQNNCTLNPGTCTGHFVQYPCGWRSNVPTQLHYLNISLDPGTDSGEGLYTFPQMVEIYKAAKANQENVIVLWWSPERLMADMAGTEAEFTPVALPLPTLECLNNRAEAGQHCATNPIDRLAPPVAVCGEPARALHTLMSTTLFTRAHRVNNKLQNTEIAEAVISPAYAALMKYELTDLQLGELFTSWNQLDDPREAVCDWVGENLDYLESLIPRSYPRTPIERDPRTPLMYASTILGGIVLGLVLLTMILVYENQHKKSIQYAQVSFLGFLLIGSCLIAIGAIIMGSPPTSGASCLAEIWFTNVGYTLELVPLIVKVAAVNYITTVGSLKRAKIKREFLFGVVAMICLLMISFLSIWTALDPPKLTQEYELTESLTEDDETIVLVLNVCASESMIWRYLCAGWNGLLLLCTTILAIQMRKVPMEGFCETPTLALLVYSHMIFVLLLVVTYLSSEHISQYTLTRCQSLIFSLDTAATIVIYFLPKFLAMEEERNNIHISQHSFHSIAISKSARALPTKESTAPSSTNMTLSERESWITATKEEAPPVDSTKQKVNHESTGTSRKSDSRFRTSTSAFFSRIVLDDNGSSPSLARNDSNDADGRDVPLPQRDDGNSNTDGENAKDFNLEDDDESKMASDFLLVSMKQQLAETRQRNEELETENDKLEKENDELKKQLLGSTHSS